MTLVGNVFNSDGFFFLHNSFFLELLQSKMASNACTYIAYTIIDNRDLQNVMAIIRYSIQATVVVVVVTLNAMEWT